MLTPRVFRYIQLGCDLRDLLSLQEIISSTVDVHDSRILLVAEVSITYSKF